MLSAGDGGCRRGCGAGAGARNFPPACFGRVKTATHARGRAGERGRRRRGRRPRAPSISPGRVRHASAVRHFERAGGVRAGRKLIRPQARGPFPLLALHVFVPAAGFEHSVPARSCAQSRAVQLRSALGGERLAAFKADGVDRKRFGAHGVFLCGVFRRTACDKKSAGVFPRNGYPQACGLHTSPRPRAGGRPEHARSGLCRQI